jgi:CHASE2 domain-containing sensor protein
VNLENFKAFLRKIELLVIMVVVIGFSLVGEKLINNIGLLESFDRSLLDFDITDLYYSNYYSPDSVRTEENILLINIGNLPRGGIATLLNKVNEYKPKVVGLNVFFSTQKEDTLGDLLLADALATTVNLVMPGRLVPDSHRKLDSVVTSIPMFSEHAMIGLIQDPKANIAGVTRSYSVIKEIKGKDYYSYPVLLTMLFDIQAFEKLMLRPENEQLIDYQGNLVDFGASDFGRKYYAVDHRDVFEEKIAPEFVKGKIVIFTYLGDFLYDDNTLIDKVFSPLSKDVYKKGAFPDIFNGVVHANIISNILNGDKIYKRNYLDWLMLIVITLIISILFRFVYQKYPRYYHLSSKTIAFIIFNLAIFLAIQLFHHTRIKIEISYILLSMLFVSDGTEMVIKWIRNEKSA